MGSEDTRRAAAGSELVGWLILVLGVGALQLPALGRMRMHDITIIDFELMHTPAEAVRQLAALGSDGIAAAQQQLAIDYAFLVLYAIALWKACRMLQARAERRDAKVVAGLAPLFAWLAAAGATFDAAENACLLAVTTGHTQAPWPVLATGFATTKFMLLGLTLVFLLLGWATTLFKRPPAPADVGQAPTG